MTGIESGLPMWQPCHVYTLKAFNGKESEILREFCVNDISGLLLFDRPSISHASEKQTVLL